jgi:hypothetical protein
MNDAYPEANQKPAEKDLALKVMQRWEAAKQERMNWSSLWDEIASYVRPPRDYVYTDRTQPPRDQSMLFDGTAISANMVLASGCMSRLTPAQLPWFSFDPPRQMAGNDRVKRWYATCTEIALEALATSNFYSELHECYLDRGAFGTSLLHIEGTMKHPLNFVSEDIGHYCVLNGADGRVDTVFREIQLTAREAAQQYPKEKLPKCIREELEQPVNSNAKHLFIHAIYPREDSERDGNKMDGENKPIASLHIYAKDKIVVRNSGYDEMPAIASRYLRWGKSSYGISPAWLALPEMRQLNLLQMNMDVLAGVNAFPRVLIPSEQEGEVDLRESGVTYFKSPENVPREWLTGGEYNIGLERVAQRKASIKEFFHVDLFQMWAAIQREVTAYEAAARENERLELFSPTFTLLTSEKIGPILRRVFALLLKQGVFPQPPEEAVYVNERGRYAIPDPEVQYTSRLALALKAVHSNGLSRVLAQFAPYLESYPQLMDNFNMDVAIRSIARNEGVPAEWMPPEDDVVAVREARAAQQAEQAQMEQAMAGADIAQKLGKSGMLPVKGGVA